MKKTNEFGNDRIKRSALLLVCLVLFLTLASAGRSEADEPLHRKHINMAAALLGKMGEQSDAATMAEMIKSCKGVAIFPNITQAGLVIGGMGGEGVVLVRGAHGKWNGPSFASIAGGSFGLQIGVKQVGLVLVINNDDGRLVFTGGKSFKLGGDVSVAAGPVGRDVQAATDSRAQASIYSYSMSKGLFAGLALSGSTINVNGDANKAYWGAVTSAETALSRRADDKRITPLTKALAKLEKKAK